MPVQLQNNSTLAVTLKGPSSGSFSLTLPSSLGTNGQALITDGSGALSFATPAVSFSGLTFSSSSSPQATSNIVASGGTTDQGLAIFPKGSGGIMMNVPNSAASGGNVRGLSSIDFQCSRTSASNVASGSYSVILGGTNNTNSGSYCVVMGTGNTASGNASLILGKSISSSGGGIGINDTNGTSIGLGYPFVSGDGTALGFTFAGSSFPTGAGTYSLVYPKAVASGTATGMIAETCFGLYYTGSTSQLLNPNGSVGAINGGMITAVNGYSGGTVADEGAVVAISATGDCKVWYWWSAARLGGSFSAPTVVAEDTGATGWSLSLALTGATATGGSADTIRWYGWNIGHGVNVL